jgi:hypothetical protein
MMKKQFGSKQISRRHFMGGAAALATITLVPRHVLGGAGKVARRWQCGQ